MIKEDVQTIDHVKASGILDLMSVISEVLCDDDYMDQIAPGYHLYWHDDGDVEYIVITDCYPLVMNDDLVDHHHILGFLQLTVATRMQKRIAEMTVSYLRQRCRGKGLGKFLYYLVLDAGYVVASGEAQTESSRRLWQVLAKDNAVHVWRQWELPPFRFTPNITTDLESVYDPKSNFCLMAARPDTIKDLLKAKRPTSRNT